MSLLVDPPDGIHRKGKCYYSLRNNLFEVDSRYVPIETIGRGAYGVVCSSLDANTCRTVAIKKIQNVFLKPNHASRALREILILGKLKHDNVIALKDVMLPFHQSSFNDVYLVYELMDTDLGSILKSSPPLLDDHCKLLLYQILCGLKYIHSANVLHRDLKPANILVNSNCDLKIADFGLARTTRGDDELMTEYVVTRWYRAPELLVVSDHYGASIDVWSVGCIFAEILGLMRPLFQGNSALNQLQQIINVLGTPPDADLEFIDNPRSKKFIKSLPYGAGENFLSMFPGANPMAIDLLKRMLVFDPRKRITVEEAFQHPYLEVLYDPMCDLPTRSPIHIDMDDNMDERMIRNAMYDEILRYHSH